ncbi:MAG: GNAT family N-acetyltransferase [Winogradskyella sp.]|uniref:GNAT family N-acetyltransferase n=1 Tax=Winogradskyella sp. TaxID=1883156 RepID=UPI00178D1225|nr:GNAT family N-acetyltransferase [Winogradskyella sp.]
MTDIETEIIYKRVSTDKELDQILDLQHSNLKHSLTEDLKQKEGFVSVEHTFEVLKKMNSACPHFIAKQNDRVIGYALCMLNTYREDVPVLQSMFNHIDEVLASKNMDDLQYLIMGQICIDKAHRGKGLFRKLYRNYRSALQKNYDALITEVNARNKRSLEAHLSVGFEVLDSHVDHNENWELIIWRWQ